MELLEKLSSTSVQLQQLQLEQQAMLFKAMQSDDPATLIKANTLWEQLKKKNEPQQSQYRTHFIHPTDTTSSNGFFQKTGGISFGGLRRMATHPIINAIISTRVEQVAEFCRPQLNGRGIGFVIRKRTPGRKTTKDDLTDVEKADIDWLTEYILNCGIDLNKWEGDSFEEFMRKVTIDTMTLDAMTFETVYSTQRKPIEFVATDAATFRFVDQSQITLTNENQIRPKYVQVIDNEQVAWFHPWELCYGVRNPQTNIRSLGYGRSELEVLIQTVTHMLYSDTYNGKFFSQGSAPKGFFKVSGHVNDTRLQQFRQQWTSMVTGVANAWRTPVIEAEGLEWVDLQKNNRDMEYSKWQEYLIKVSCATYKMDPREVGFDVGGGSGGSPLIESGNETFLKYSKDKGLRPLIRFLEAKLNKYVMMPLAPKYEFAFTGIDEQSEQQELELDIKRAGLFMSLKEIRRKYQLPDTLEDGDAIMSPTYLQWMAQQQQAQQQAQMAQQGGGDPNQQLQEDESYDGAVDDYEDNPMYKALITEFEHGKF